MQDLFQFNAIPAQILNNSFENPSQINMDYFDNMDDRVDFLYDSNDFNTVISNIFSTYTPLPWPACSLPMPLNSTQDILQKSESSNCISTTTTTNITNTVYNFSTVAATDKSKRGTKRKRSKLCIECNTCATFGAAFTRKPLYCLAHKPTWCVDVVHSRCLECNKRAYYGIKGTTKRKYCRKHKSYNHVTLSNRVCTYTMFGQKCEKRARYGPLFKNKLFCLKHKTDNDYSVVRIKCISMVNDTVSKRCKNIPIYTTHGQNHPLRCEIHKFQDDIKIFNKLCVGCHKVYVIPYDKILCNVCSQVSS